MNALEIAFGQALDKTGLTWCRNPSRSGYGIPLITIGNTRSFYPDFLVWRGNDVLAVDTTGGHLLADKTGRKLLSIAAAKGKAGRLVVRFVSEGKWDAQLQQLDTNGYSVWGQKQDLTLRVTAIDSIDEAVARVIAKDPA